MWLFSWIGQGNSLGDFTHRYAVRRQTRGIQRAVGELVFKSRKTFSLACRTTHDPWNEYSITLGQREDQLILTDEKLTGTNRKVPLFEVVGADREEGIVQVAYNNFTRGNQKLQVTCSNQMAVLIQLQVLARLGMRKLTLKDFPQALEQYRGWLPP